MQILVEQIVVPFYRVTFFKTLQTSFVPHELEVLAGSKSTTADTKNFSEALEFIFSGRTRLFFGGSAYGVAGFWRRALKSDVIICTFSLRNVNFYLSLLVCLFARKKKLIFWGHIHGRNKFANIPRKFASRLGHGFLCYTELNAAEMMPSYLGLKTEVSYLGNSLYSENQFQTIERKYLSVNTNRKMSFVYSGRLIREKGLAELIHGFAKAKLQNGSEIQNLHIIGSGSMLSELHEIVRDYRLEKDVIFHGEVLEDEKIGEIYCKCCAAICCGYLGLNVIQAFAHGLPMIFRSNAPHSPEVEACVEGFNSHSYKSFDQLVEIISNKENLLKLSATNEEIHNDVKKKYNSDLMASRFSDFVKRTCEI